MHPESETPLTRPVLHRALPGLTVPIALAFQVAHAHADSGAATALSLPATIAAMQPASAQQPAARPSTSITEDLYLLADVGVAIPQTVRLADISPTATSGGLGGGELHLNTGLRLDAGLGFQATEWLAFEVETGLIWNGVDDVSGSITTLGAGDLALSGGSGNVYNVPILFNGQVRVPMGKSMKLLVGGGVGTIWSDASVDSINTALLPGVEASVHGSSWAFAYQANAGVEWELATNLTLGVRYAFLGTTQLNYGPASFNTPLLAGSSDIKADALYTHSILATLKLEF